MKEIYQEFDSHLIIKDLISSGLTEKQAEKITYAMLATRKIDLSHLVTKEHFDREFTRLEAKIDNETAKIEATIHVETSKLEAKINKNTAILLKWSFVQMIIIIATLSGIITAMNLF